MIKALKLSWITRILATENMQWKFYLNERLRHLGGIELFLQCNFDKKLVQNLNLSQFYKELLIIWANNIKAYDKIEMDISEILWNNKNI